MAKPSYKSARKTRGTATMTIEAAPKTDFTDKELPSPDHERFPGNTISPEDTKSDAKPESLVTHPGEWHLSNLHSNEVKT